MDKRFLSPSFKLWVVSFIFFLIFIHLYLLQAYPDSQVIPEELLLGVTLVLVGYLWVQEYRDRRRLEELHLALLNAHERLKQAEIDTISVLILTEEAKNPYLKGHSNRVAQYALAIAKEMGSSEDMQDLIRRAGMLHDIGKIGISDQILNKPDRLDEKEWEIMKNHPRQGVNLLKPLQFLSREKEIVLHHHERIDGQGYPEGERTREVSVGARIIAVADAFDAMNSERSYRKKMSRDQIIDQLEKAAGTQLDATAVEVFLGLLEKNPYFWALD